MTTNLTILVVLVGGLAIIAAGFGLSTPIGQNGQYDFTTLRGQTARILGQGLYEFDTVFFGAGFRGQDAVVLFAGIPLLAVSLFLYRQGSTVGHLLLVGALGYFLYVYASMALGAAYNRLFLVYVGVFSASLYAFVLAFSSVNLSEIAESIPQGLPSKSLAFFMIFSGVVTLYVWGAPLVDAFLKGVAPDRMDSYTTMVTYALDLAIITPATILCAVLVLRGEPMGYLIATPLLTVIVLLAPQIILSTIYQRAAGVPFTAGEMIGPIAGFVILGLVGGWLMFDLLRTISRVT